MHWQLGGVNSCRRLSSAVCLGVSGLAFASESSVSLRASLSTILSLSQVHNLLTLPFSLTRFSVYSFRATTTVMVIATRPGNSKKHPGMIDAPAVRRTTAEVQSAKKKKELEKKRNETKTKKAQKQMVALEHNMVAAERKRQMERSKERPLANEARGAGRVSSRPESPSPPSRPSTVNAKKPPNNTRSLNKRSKKRPLADDAHGTSRHSSLPESPSPPDRSSNANPKKPINTVTRKREGQSINQPPARTAVPSRPESTRTHRRNAHTVPTGDNEEPSETSGDDEGEVTSAKRRKITQSNAVGRPSRRIPALVKRREKSVTISKTAGR